ncbi:protein adenylyltransferase SelO [Alteromonas sp. OM2203]|uniref:protein adenylyltransferase SelO n=1 Tax=Alteromonas sp. OM2203 TaxID=3398817 RepID=UPI003AF3F142
MTERIKTLDEFAKHVDYSLLNTLSADPQSTSDGDDHDPRQVFSGHYVPVTPTPLTAPKYIAHSKTLFAELGLDDSLATSKDFTQLFAGDMSGVPAPMKPYGWATGYALSIYGTEYTQQCPFRTGNGYGDGRAISIVEAVLNGKRWEMQLKGAGRTPYCRGADGRAVLRSSVREFLVQEHMHALGIPTSRSLSLFMSESDTVDRPWYREGSHSYEPEVMVENITAISTRVAPSFLRVGQIELFARRARCNEHSEALKELEAIVKHLIEREYSSEIDTTTPFEEQVVTLAALFRDRLTSLVSGWVRVGYCQGNFNSDNCAAGGFTLDYGPFGFCEFFEADYQPWTGGGRHFSFLNQPIAAQKNFDMFCRSLMPLLEGNSEQLAKLNEVNDGFSGVMERAMESMWATKLGFANYDHDLLIKLLQLMLRTGVDYNLFFRELSSIPEDMTGLTKSFYYPPKAEVMTEWETWLQSWRERIEKDAGAQGDVANTIATTAENMRKANPKFTWREWLIVPAYKAAEKGDFTQIHELQNILTAPYDEQSEEIENKYYQLRPLEFFSAGGVAHYSCSS